MTTDFKQIKLNEDLHRYYLNGRELTGVNAKIRTLEKPFDAQAIAEKTARKQGKTVEQVFAEWEAAKLLGINTHKHIQEMLLGKNGKPTDPFLSLNTKPAEFTAFDVFWAQLSQMVSYEKKHVEWIIGDDELGLAGNLDTMFFSPTTGQYHIWDWKTGKFTLDNQFACLFHPFNDLDASKLNIYSLQVSAYRLMVERNTGLILGDSYLVHLSSLGHTVYPAIDYRGRLLAWLQGRE